MNTRSKTELIKKSLIIWGKSHFRNFPWRISKDPYRIMIAEFMLHRTKAEQVVPVYNEFILRYPDIFSLSCEDYSDLKMVTEHLGLHWRARHFIEAAKYIVEKYDGKFPKTTEELRSIPGFGEYITGAICTICLKRPYPVVDSNIARFIARVYGIESSGELRRNKEIIELARSLFKVRAPGQFLFSILDFTAEVCVARNPHHSVCPFKNICLYIANERNRTIKRD